MPRGLSPRANWCGIESLPRLLKRRPFTRLTPEVVSLLDYTKGFGHTDLVTC
jgi:hypothetical protein